MTMQYKLKCFQKHHSKEEVEVGEGDVVDYCRLYFYPKMEHSITAKPVFMAYIPKEHIAWAKSWCLMLNENLRERNRR